MVQLLVKGNVRIIAEGNAERKRDFMGEREATWQGKGRLFQTYGASWPDVKKLDNVQKMMQVECKPWR